MMLFKVSKQTESIVADITRLDDDEEFDGIRCPHCAWRPSSDDRWCCVSTDGPEPPFQSCGTAWNTFATKGRCPGCHHQWQWTVCLRCVEWSRHADWYERGSDRHE